jgi:hypothetical protein
MAHLFVLSDLDVCHDDMKEKCQKFGRVRECEVIKLATEGLPSDYAVVKVVLKMQKRRRTRRCHLRGGARDHTAGVTGLRPFAAR